MNSSHIFIATMLLICVYLWRKSKKEDNENRRFIILNTLDHYLSLDPSELAFKVHRKYEANFLLDPTLLYQIVYSRLIGNKYVQCSILFRYNAKKRKFVNDLEIWDNQLVMAVCPLKLKHHKSSLYQYIVQELEAIHNIPITAYNEDAEDEYNELVMKFLVDKNHL